LSSCGVFEFVRHEEKECDEFKAINLTTDMQGSPKHTIDGSPSFTALLEDVHGGIHGPDTDLVGKHGAIARLPLFPHQCLVGHP